MLVRISLPRELEETKESKEVEGLKCLMPSLKVSWDQHEAFEMDLNLEFFPTDRLVKLWTLQFANA